MSTLPARLVATLLVGTLGLGLLGFVSAPAPDAPAQEAVAVVEAEAPIEEPPFYDTLYKVRSGDTIGSILPRHGVKDVEEVLAAVKPHTDLSRLRAGTELRFHYRKDVSRPLSLTLALDEDRSVIIDLSGDVAQVELIEAEYTSQIGVHVIDVVGSLWDSALKAGLRPADIVRIANVFQWELDFNTEIQRGARIVVVSDDLYDDGGFVRPDALRAVRIENGGKTLVSIRHVSASGEEGWFHPDGTGARKPFLRSPLEFSRVTSGFNPRRFHPVLKKARPHNGTDFGAPTGTPIRAVADAVVTFAGKSGGYGNHVKLDHEGPYVTSYSHLSRIRVKNGQKVKQGDVIGEVGSTGMSTGPHLHYEFLSGGKHVDPMKIKLPTTGGMSAAELASFHATRDALLPLLNGELPPPPPPVWADDGGEALAEGE